VRVGTALLILRPPANQVSYSCNKADSGLSFIFLRVPREVRYQIDLIKNYFVYVLASFNFNIRSSSSNGLLGPLLTNSLEDDIFNFLLVLEW